MTNTNTKPDVKEFFLPKGIYYIGDPSYVLKEDDYDELLDDDNESLFKTGLTELHGHKMFILGDGPGDGSYQMKDNYEDDEDDVFETYIPVDSGCWGVIPVELLIDDETTEDDLFKWGHVLDSTMVEDEDGPIKEFDVTVTYKQDVPAFAEFLGYKLTIQDWMDEDEDA